MKTILNPYRYIDKDVIEQCFVKGKMLNVDKQICGNGFSTAFMKMHTTLTNIMIVPNVRVAEQKKETYDCGGFPDKKMIFYFKNSQRTGDWTQYDTVVVVWDSFKILYEEFINMKYYINWIMIDEAHTMDIQSSFRKKLKTYRKDLEPFLQHSAVSCVTATPLRSTSIDIFIKNDMITYKSIKVRSNAKKGISRAKELLDNGETVVIATNDINIIVKFKKNGTLIANFMVGDRLLQSCTEHFNITHSEKSNLIFMSSRAFEGHDINVSDVNVFFFEYRDENSEYTTHYPQNVIQALCRPRNGTKYLEYNRVLGDNKIKPHPPKSKIQNHIERIDILDSQKMKGEFRELNRWIISKRVGQKFDLNIDEIAINLNKETVHFDENVEMFADYFYERGFTLDVVHERQMKNNPSRLAGKQKIKYLSLNHEFIRERDLFGEGYHIRVPMRWGMEDTMNKSIKRELDSYNRRKNYDGAYEPTVSEKAVITFLDDSIRYEELFNQIIKRRKQLNIKKYGRREGEKKESTESLWHYKRAYSTLLLKMAHGLYIEENYIGYRDYNAIYVLKPELVQMVYDAVKLPYTVTELDIVSCNPRIVYALNDLALPNNFYGENKENKKSINMALNQIWYDESKVSAMKFQKQNTIRRLERLNINPIVINHLVKNYFNPFKGKFFNDASYQENELIYEVFDELEKRNPDNHGIYKRMDSVILIEEKKGDHGWLANYSFLGQKGWFKNASGDDSKPPFKVQETIQSIDFDEPTDVKGIFDFDSFWDDS